MNLIQLSVIFMVIVSFPFYKRHLIYSLFCYFEKNDLYNCCVEEFFMMFKLGSPMDLLVLFNIFLCYTSFLLIILFISAAPVT